MEEKDIVWIVDQENRDWWVVLKICGSKGYVPSNYLEFQTGKIQTHSRNNSITKPIVVDSTEDRNSSWASLMDSKVLSSYSEMERKRQEAMFELISTEQKYVRSLMVIIQVQFMLKIKVFYYPLNRLFDAKKVFGNINIIYDLNSKFLDQLEKYQKSKNYILDSLANFLKDFVKKLEYYCEYCSNQKEAIKVLQQRRNEDKSVGDFLKESLRNPMCRGLDLSSFLLEPMQRLTRYPLLIKQVN